MAVFWISNAFSTKKTLKNSGGWGMRITAIIAISLVFIIINSKNFLNINVWRQTPTILITADIITFLGLITMIWARKTLGKNWSANIVLKESHELITNGPYAYVRHPIYSGLILMVLGITIYSGNFVWIIFFIIFFCGAYYKGIKEEELLIEHFPQTYPDYKFRVKALIPHIL
jgi:protein-S-isoprenylcysteine O-methyltransferase Ste14